MCMRTLLLLSSVLLIPRMDNPLVTFLVNLHLHRTAPEECILLHEVPSRDQFRAHRFPLLLVVACKYA